jgi:hypothetical protein
MTVTVDVYVNSVKVATAVATANSATLGTVSDVSGLWGAYAKSGSSGSDSLRGFLVSPEVGGNGTRSRPPHRNPYNGLVQVHATSGANAIGKSIQTKIITDAGSTSLVMDTKWPFSD